MFLPDKTDEARLHDETRLEAKTLFDWIRREHPDQFLDSHRRTFERCVGQWRERRGPNKTVVFRQVYHAGDIAASDFTRMNSLAVTLAGHPHVQRAYAVLLVKLQRGAANLPAKSTVPSHERSSVAEIHTDWQPAVRSVWRKPASCADELTEYANPLFCLACGLLDQPPRRVLGPRLPSPHPAGSLRVRDVVADEPGVHAILLAALFPT